MRAARAGNRGDIRFRQRAFIASRPVLRGLGTVLTAALALSVTAHPGRAQAGGTPADKSAPAVAPVTQPTFAEYIRAIAKRRGDNILLVVLPAKIASQTMPPATELPEALPENLVDFAGKMNSTIRRFGPISVMTGKTMTVYVDHPGTPVLDEVDWRGDRSHTVAKLIPTLSDAQWRVIASPRGLTFADCASDQQRALWEECIPNPLTVERTNTAYRGRKTPPEKMRTLTDAERYQVGLRLKLLGQIRGELVSMHIPYPLISKKNAMGGGKEALAVSENPVTADAPPPEDVGEKIHGVVVIAKKPSRTKNADIDYDALTAPVSLAPPADGTALTVGELVARIAKATGLELYVHKGAADFAAILAGNDVEGRTVSAGDLLASLTCGLQGTVRRLPATPDDPSDLYVLTRDQEPLAVQQARLEVWDRAAGRDDDAETVQRWKAVGQKNPLRYLQFDPDDPGAMSPALIAAYSDGLRKGTRSVVQVGIPIRFTDLSSVGQLAVTAKTKELADESATPEFQSSHLDLHVAMDRLSAACNVNLGLFVPGTGPFSGDIDDAYVNDLLSILPPKKDEKASVEAVSVTGRNLLLRVTDAQEARSAVRLAKARGASAVWIEGSPSDLTIAVASAEGKLPVFGIVRLSSATNAPADLPRDRNVYGDVSRDWLTPDDPAVAVWAGDRVRHVAAILGIAGIVLRDISAPGYRGPSVDDWKAYTWTGNNGRDVATPDPAAIDEGFTIAHRRAFLRQAGADPADLMEIGVAHVGEAVGGANRGPFGRSEPLDDAWESWLQTRSLALLRSVRREARDVPVILEGETVFQKSTTGVGGDTVSDATAWFLSWPMKTPDPPPLYLGAWRTTISLPDADATIVAIVGPHTTTPASELLERTHRATTPGATVVDLSFLSIKDAEAWLTAANAPSPDAVASSPEK